MKRSTYPIHLALWAAAILSVACPGTALAQAPKEHLSFKATVSGKSDPFLIPMDPPVLSVRMTLKGTSDLLGGEVTYIDTHMVHLGVDGLPLKSTDGLGVFTSPTGDALFVSWDTGPRDLTTAPNPLHGTAAFIVRGGRGRFVGATGSGVVRAVINLETFEVSQVWEGMISRPKP